MRSRAALLAILATAPVARVAILLAAAPAALLAILLAAAPAALLLLAMAPAPALAEDALPPPPPPLSPSPQDSTGNGAERDVNLTIRAHGDPMDLIRDRLHPKASKVPAFPHDDHRLLDPAHWPETMTFAGEKLQRHIHAWDGYIGSSLRSVRERKPRMRLVLSYVHPGTSVNAGVGPRYTWDERQHLAERIWYDSDSTRLTTQDYTYYADGRLLGYSWRSGPRNPAPGAEIEDEYLSEFFDRSGKLIAVGYEKKIGEGTISAYLWDGQPVAFDDFRMKSHVLYASSR